MIPFPRLARGLWVGFFSLLHCATRAASGDSAWSFHVWQSDEGLPNNSITSLAQTDDGYLWAANPSRLVRFDGVQFETFPPKTFGASPHQKVQAVLRGHAGGLWLAMEHGVVAYLNSGRTEIFTKGLPDLRSQTITQDAEGSLWITYSRGIVYRLKNGEGQLFGAEAGLPSGPACSLARDKAGQLWFAKSAQGDGQVGVFRDEHFQTLLHFDRATIRLAAAHDGGIWLCSGARLLKCREGEKPEELGEFMPEQNNVKAKALFEDSQGAVWIGTSDSGLFRFDGYGFEKVPTSHPEISDLLEDREGNLWVATSGGGLNRVRRHAVELEEVGKGLPFTSIVSLCEATNGVMWAASQNGSLFCRTTGVWSEATARVGWSGSEAACVAADRDGAVWIGTKAQALYRLQAGQSTAWRAADGLASKSVRALLASTNGDLWIGGEFPSGLQCLRSGKLLSFKVPPNVRLIRALAQDGAGDIWAGTSAGKLLRVHNDVVTDRTPRTSGEPMSIRSLYPTADGSLWIGYATAGLGRLQKGRFARITQEQGLYDDHISQIVADGRGWLWFGADRGIFKIPQQELDQAADGRVGRVRATHYGRDEGLVSLQANFDASPGTLRTQDGRLWIPMRTAVAVINPMALHEDQEPPPVLLRRVVLDERTIATYGGVMPVNKISNLGLSKTPLRLPPKHRLLEFEFTALNLGAPENLHFRYRLEGFDEGWIEADAQRKASYPRLPAGNYSFHAAACNSYGVWNETQSPLVFSVAPFFWQTWPFLAASLIGFTLLVAAIVRYVSFRRLRFELRMLEQQAALDKERTRIARDLHDDLGGSLTQVSLLLDKANRNSPAPDKAGNGVQQCSSLVRQVARSVDEIIWAINPRNDTLRYLVDYISQFVVEFLHAANIRCRVDLPDQLPDRTVSPEARHNLFLVVKETLNNIARHSRASEVQFQVTATGSQLLLIVSDNGQGFNGSTSSATGDGLRNMRQRMEEIGATFDLESKPDTGTRAVFSYPYK
jgi:signal transduction histidine kinase/ligand-binding sensor domain-containing protein